MVIEILHFNYEIVFNSNITIIPKGYAASAAPDDVQSCFNL